MCCCLMVALETEASTAIVLGKSRRRKPSRSPCHRPLLFATTLYVLCYCCELQWSHHRQSLVLRCTITSTLP